MIDLAAEKYLCEDLRKHAPDHTYENDAQIVKSWKSLLDLNMGIPYPDTEKMMDLILRAHGGHMQGQKAMLALLIPLVQLCEHPDGLANGYCHICVRQIVPYSQSDRETAK